MRAEDFSTAASACAWKRAICDAAAVFAPVTNMGDSYGGGRTRGKGGFCLGGEPGGRGFSRA
ncbi:hypothetical protein Ari01nite_55540 [Paractinoplanes rishiriensis]|uniref:Uncharacterized protein n=1 Tax=Paractinoplanes rishiriensis TaxID=1050105 RepID=A0A919K3G4_9ACTN|nr:hypothetical protein Ari01nite_55540 [Actinoplanes rishiriensis]